MAAATAVSIHTSRHTARFAARWIAAGARILMGGLFFLSGLNGLFNLLPPPAVQLPQGATAFLGALMNTGYMFPMIMTTQLIVGALLLANRYVPLALVLIAPFIVNSVAFHAFLEPSGRIMASIVLMLELGLAWYYRSAYRPLLSMRPAASNAG